MKTIFILLTVHLTCSWAWLSSEDQEQIKKFSANCSVELGTTIGELQLALVGESHASEDKLKCFAACLLKKMDIMNEDGTINKEVIKSKAPKDMPEKEIEEIIQKCTNTGGKDDCEKAGNFLKCAIKTVVNKEFN
ncbi:general odorant-binding protein 19d [Osmia bicornis bicornis]|uniref:general odorant-binding protein 19d n=1 Tax=Osmia bicornis bicornis TaxID=1437191 RepID=UPI0010F9A78D|nr:general odorant-binding protein 19d [Osmia bicornis bicornis]